MIDIILSGGGAGGDGGTAGFGTGGGREAGKWASMTIQRGVSIGWNVNQIAITVGAGGTRGAGGNGGLFSGSPGGNGAVGRAWLRAYN